MHVHMHTMYTISLHVFLSSWFQGLKPESPIHKACVLLLSPTSGPQVLFLQQKHFLSGITIILFLWCFSSWFIYYYSSALLSIGNISKSLSLPNAINTLFTCSPRSLIKMLNMPDFLISTLQHPRETTLPNPHHHLQIHSTYFNAHVAANSFSSLNQCSTEPRTFSISPLITTEKPNNFPTN